MNRTPLVALFALCALVGCDKTGGGGAAGTGSAKPAASAEAKPDPEVAKQIKILEDPKAAGRAKVDAADEIGKLGPKALPQLQESWKKGDASVRVALMYAAGALKKDGLQMVLGGVGDQEEAVWSAACSQVKDNAKLVVADEALRTKMVAAIGPHREQVDCFAALAEMANERKARDGEK